MIISRRVAALLALTPVAAFAAPSRGDAVAAKVKEHRVAVHMNSRDPAAVSAALNNVDNLYGYYMEKGDKIQVRIVAHGAGLHMLREDTSLVKDRLAAMRRDHATMTLAACGNTKRNMEREEGKPVLITAMAEIVPSGVVELVALQEKGWTYLRP